VAGRQGPKLGSVDAGAGAAGIDQPSVGIVVGEQQGAERWPGAFGIGPADDDKFLAVQTFDLEPQAAVAAPPSRGRAHAREAAGNQRPWPADKVERWAIDRLIPYAKNARTHSDAQIAAIAANIKEWGWTTPALVGEDGGLIAGHARILAARQLGIAEIPVMVAAGWSEAQKRAYVLAVNQLAITGSGWDPELISVRSRGAPLVIST
jgi:hypothetical protein